MLRPRFIDPRPAPKQRRSTDRYESELRAVGEAVVLPERVFRYAIVGFILLFAVMGTVSMFSALGPAPGAPRIICAAICVTTVPVGVAMSRLHIGTLWWSKTAGPRWARPLFVTYADLGLTGVLATFSAPSSSLFGTGLFAIIGAYVAHFTWSLTRTMHVLFSSAVIVVFAAQTYTNGDTDLAAAVARASSALLVANGTIALHSLYNGKLRQSLAINYDHATTDPLTGIANRRAFHRRAEWLVATAADGVQLLVVDVDEFKSINDRFGHEHGDEILRRLARALAEVFDDDAAVVARMGGDEFAVALPAASRSRRELDHLTDRLRLRLPPDEGTTVTIGIARSHAANPVDPARALATLLNAADKDLYVRKHR